MKFCQINQNNNINFLIIRIRNLSPSSREGGHRSDPEKPEPGPEVRIRTQGGNHFADRHLDAFLSSHEKLLKLEQIKLIYNLLYKSNFLWKSKIDLLNSSEFISDQHF